MGKGEPQIFQSFGVDPVRGHQRFSSFAEPKAEGPSGDRGQEMRSMHDPGQCPAELQLGDGLGGYRIEGPFEISMSDGPGEHGHQVINVDPALPLQT